MTNLETPMPSEIEGEIARMFESGAITTADSVESLVETLRVRWPNLDEDDVREALAALKAH